MMTKKKHIILTGASGFVGQHLLHSFLTSPSFLTTNTNDTDNTTKEKENDDEENCYEYEIHALYHQNETFTDAVKEWLKLISSVSNNVSVTMVPLDITNKEKIDEWKQKIITTTTTTTTTKLSLTDDFICIHTAALSSPRQCQTSSDRATKLNDPIHFFQAIYPIPIIAFSTDQVYDGNLQIPINNEDESNNKTEELHNNECDHYYIEEDNDNNNTNKTQQQQINNKKRPCPINIYGKTKLQMEDSIRKLWANNSMYILLRSSIVIGPKAPFTTTNVHDTFFHFVASRDQQSTTFFTNEYRTIVSMSYVFQIIQWFIRRSLHLENNNNNNNNNQEVISGIYNLGGPFRLSRYDMAQAVYKYRLGYNNNNDIEKYCIKAKQTSTTSPLDISMNCTKLITVTRIQPIPKTLQGLVDYTFSSNN